MVYFYLCFLKKDFRKMMIVYKKYINAARWYVLSRRLFVLLSVMGLACWVSPMRVNAQDSIPKSNSGITRLKQSLDQVVTDADQVKALLQTSKDLNYLPGQVVALCQL